MHPDTIPSGADPADADTTEEIVPDYSRLGFRDLRKLVKSRGMPADGRQPELIDKLKAWDAEYDQAPDLTVPEGDDEFDLLADDEPGHAPVAPAPPPATPNPAPTATEPPTPAPGLGAQAPTGGGEGASAPPPGGLPRAADDRGRADLSAREGVVRVGEGYIADVRGFRHEFLIDGRDITDDDHFRFIAETHQAAQRAGYQTKGGIGIGQRIGYADRDGRRTVIYQVPLRRQQ